MRGNAGRMSSGFAEFCVAYLKKTANGSNKSKPVSLVCHSLQSQISGFHCLYKLIKSVSGKISHRRESMCACARFRFTESNMCGCVMSLSANYQVISQPITSQQSRDQSNQSYATVLF